MASISEGIMTKRLALLAGLAGAFLLTGSGAGAFFGLGGSQERPTNVEVRILSQSCFQGEVEPCG
jgi:hypothetical protein